MRLRTSPLRAVMIAPGTGRLIQYYSPACAVLAGQDKTVNKVSVYQPMGVWMCVHLTGNTRASVIEVS